MERPKIKIGYRVGMLETVEPTEQRKSGYVVWRCRCNCGGEILLDTRCLQRGAVRDCGCIRYEEINEQNQDIREIADRRCPPLKDYVGKRFGMLVAEAYAGKENGQHKWKCRCDCGRMTAVRQTYLQSGKTKSCGCVHAAVLRSNMKYTDGTSVTALERVKKKMNCTNTSGYTGVYWNKNRGKWSAYITFKSKKYYLGLFNNIEEAVEARKRSEEMHDDFLALYYQEQKG